MSRQEEVDERWSWVANCLDPSQVTDDNVRTAYGLDSSICETRSRGKHVQNCQNNGFCLHKLDEDGWSRKYNRNPEKQLREPGMAVGLENVGQTCYVNSVLQTLFYNQNFRKAILKWQPSPQSMLNADDILLMNNFQMVMALMQDGKQRFYDPTNFVDCVLKALKLKKRSQEDAQEFSKLFLTKLESILSFQSEKDVRDLVKDNFCGEYSYVTRCMKCLKESECPSKFYELTLNIKEKKTIQDSLNEYLEKEILDGDNKYLCANCGDKQDAERFISIEALPPVLNLQLMRYYYDINTNQNCKLSTAIQFPEKLNMSEFCDSIGDGFEYTLSAVLSHQGKRAKSGHYVALVCDSETGTWYHFSDETVQKIDNENLKFVMEDADGTQESVPKFWYESKTAYVLSYRRNETTPSDEEMTLLPHLRSFVTNNNEQFEKWVDERKHSKKPWKSTTLFDERVEELKVAANSKEFDAVQKSWLQQWLIHPEKNNVIDNKKVACQHNKLDPNEVLNVKFINSKVAEKLFAENDGGPRLRYDEFLCKDCVTNKCFQIQSLDKVNVPQTSSASVSSFSKAVSRPYLSRKAKENVSYYPPDSPDSKASAVSIPKRRNFPRRAKTPEPSSNPPHPSEPVHSRRSRSYGSREPPSSSHPPNVAPRSGPRRNRSRSKRNPVFSSLTSKVVKK